MLFSLGQRVLVAWAQQGFACIPLVWDLSMRMLSLTDQLLAGANRALGVLWAEAVGRRPYPVVDDGRDDDERATLDEARRAESAALMRVNHVGEICAQALYEAQALGTRDPQLREMFLGAADEERDHLAWTQQRIRELGGRTSLLNPLWHAGAFGIGLLAARLGDRVSLGFMAETERQVEQHLQGHLERLPQADLRSRRIVAAMRDDEAAHAARATEHGGVDLPLPVRFAMRVAARVMTRTAHHI
jgi:ubiquinone biosynthesis monooxygenase Coq7